jgi:hypothetical protein
MKRSSNLLNESLGKKPRSGEEEKRKIPQFNESEDLRVLMEEIEKNRTKKKGDDNEEKKFKTLFIPVTIDGNEFLGVVYESENEAGKFVQTDPKNLTISRVVVKLPLDDKNYVYVILDKDTNIFYGLVYGSEDKAYELVYSDPDLVFSRTMIQRKDNDHYGNDHYGNDHYGNDHYDNDNDNSIELYVPVSADDNSFLGKVFLSRQGAENWIIDDGLNNVMIVTTNMNVTSDSKKVYVALANNKFDDVIVQNRKDFDSPNFDNNSSSLKISLVPIFIEE